MKQKFNSTVRSIVNLVLFFALIAATVIPSVVFDVKKAQANEICQPLSTYLEIVDTTPDPDVIVASYAVDNGEQFPETVFDLELTPGHVYRYTHDSSVASFTSGRTYQTDDGYSHHQHSYSPNPTPGMSNIFTAPPIQTDGFIMVSTHQNVCTPGPNTIGGGGAAIYVNLIVDEPSGPSYITRTTNSNLAIYGRPDVSLLVNGQSEINVDVNDTANMTWNTEFVNPGDSCTVANNNSDSTWSGSKNGPGGGAQSVGPFLSSGTFTYTITCQGYQSTSGPTRSVIINVAIPLEPTFSCELMSGGSHNVTKGFGGSSTFRINPVNGFVQPVTFSLESITPPGGNPPSVAVANTAMNPNPLLSPYDKFAKVDISTDINTTAGRHQIIIRATPAVGTVKSCPPINFTVDGGVGGLPPDVDIYCDTNSPVDCTIPYGGDSIIRWASRNSTVCTVYKNGVVWDNRLDASRSSGPLTDDTQFSATCDDADPTTDPKTDLIWVRVSPPAGPSAPTAWITNPCGEVNVNWSPGGGSTPVTDYRVYRSTSSSGPWPESSAISGLLPNTQTSFPDPSPSISGYWYMVRAFNNSSPSPDSNSVLGTLEPCIPDLSSSDKDLYRVDNNTSGSTALRCNDRSDLFALPSGGIFKTGSTVYFNINICNTGFGPITGVTVTEIDARNLDQVKLLGTTRGSVCTASGIGTSGPYGVSDVVPNTECSLRISAKLKAPVGATSFLYRFWNTAEIRTNEDSIMTPPGPTRVTTPPYLFSDTGKPTRNETAQ